MVTILSSFALVAISEMGDKTQLLAFSLAARFKRPWAIMLGILLATILNHALAASTGAWVASRVPPRGLAIFLAVTFIGFGFWTLKPDTFEEGSTEAKYGVVATTAVLFFLAEMGDKTQLATAALSARYGSVILVTLGTTLGMMASDGLAVFMGERLARSASGTDRMKWARRIAAGLFFVFGAVSAMQAISG